MPSQIPPQLPPQLRGTEFFAVTGVPLSVFRVFSDSSSRHRHDFYEFVLVTGGTGQHELFPPSGQSHQVNAMKRGELFAIPVGWSHAYGESSDLEIFNILFALQVVERWRPITAGFGILDELSDCSKHWSLQRSEFEHLETLLQTVTRELVGRKHGFQLAAESRLAEVLVWIERLNNGSGERRNLGSEEAISRVVALMERDFAQPLTLYDLARTAHLSPNYFCEVFKNATGLSPGRYLLRLRLEHARHLLLTTVRPVTQVARESGFSDPSYFARAFKAAFGTAPTRLRSTGR